MNEKQVTLGEVRAAFDTLLEVVNRECDYRTSQTVYWAAEDVMQILAGEWADGSPLEDAKSEMRDTSSEGGPF